MKEPDSQRERGNRIATIATTAIIVVLMLGYIPLGGYLFKKNFTIEYEIKVGDEYDEQFGSKSQADVIDVVMLDEGGSTMLSGLTLRKRYTELTLDILGVDPESIEVTAAYAGDPEQLWMHVGGLYESSAYTTPLYIRNLAEGDWYVMGGGETSLYQQESRFENLDDFYTYAATSSEDIGLAGIDPGEVLARSLNGGDTEPRQLLAMPLRGPHTLEMIVGGDSLHVEVTKRDLNRSVGSDEVALTIEHNGAVVYEVALPDDGDTGADGLLSTSRETAAIDLADIESGQYTLKVSPQLTADDFVITGLVADADKAVFKDRVLLFEPLETEPDAVIPAINDIDVWLDSPTGILTATTWHPITPRSVSMDGEELIAFEAKGVEAPVQTGTVVLEEGIKELQVEGPGSLILEFLGGGFAFSPEPLFDPYFTHLQPLENPAAAGKDFAMILTEGYQPPETSGDVAVSERTAEIAGRSFPGKKLRIILEKIGREEVIVTSLRVVLK